MCQGTETREEKREKGRIEGRTEEPINLLLSFLTGLGEVPREMCSQAAHIDSDTLKAWVKLAARADSMDEFIESIR